MPSFLHLQDTKFSTLKMEAACSTETLVPTHHRSRGHFLNRVIVISLVTPVWDKNCFQVGNLKNWIGHILRRNCLLQRVVEGKIQGGIKVTGRQGRRRRKLLDDLKERRGYSHLKEEALDRTMWRASFGTGFGPVVRQTTK